MFRQNDSEEKITLGGREFPTVDSVKQHVQDVIFKIKGDVVEITDPDTKVFLAALFSKHRKIGKKPRMFYGKNTSFKGKTTHCFYLQQPDGAKEDISYIKCLACVRDEAVAKRAATLNLCYEKSGGPQLVILVHNILQSAGKGQAEIVKILEEKFPFFKRALFAPQFCYFRMMLELATKCENERAEQMLGICVAKYLQIDAEIDSSGARPAAIVTDTPSLEQKRARAKTRLYPEPEIRAKLLLELFILHFEAATHESEGRVDRLLKVFEERIIPAPRTSYTQYILLHLFSREDMQVFREKFVSLLFLQAFNTRLSLEIRLRYLNYFASFLASARCVEAAMVVASVRMVLRKLTDSAKKLRKNIIQSLLYIACYRWKELDEEPSLAGELVETVVKDEEQSLLFIDGSILAEFALLLRHVDCVEYAHQIAVLERFLGEQREKRVTAVSVYFLFGAAGTIPAVSQKLRDCACFVTHRQAEVNARKGSNATNSGSVGDVSMDSRAVAIEEGA